MSPHPDRPDLELLAGCWRNLETLFGHLTNRLEALEGLECCLWSEGGRICGRKTYTTAPVPLCFNHWRKLQRWAREYAAANPQSKSRHRPHDSVVYALRIPDGRVKIGYTTHLGKRLSQHRHTWGEVEVLAVWPGGAKEEGEVHNLFAHLAAPDADSVELFAPADELLDFLETQANEAHPAIYRRWQAVVKNAPWSVES